MHAVLGATGHVGFATVKALLAKGEDVLAIIHSPEKADTLKKLGANVALCDVKDVPSLRSLLKKADSLFLLNPPAAPSTDTVREEKETLSKILEALPVEDLKRVVGESTYGAQRGDGIGDLGVLYEMETALEKKPFETKIIRAAYYMSNWAESLKHVMETGELETLYPADFKLPMIAPQDLGDLAADLLTASEPTDDPITSAEGPQRYCANDVAEAFQKALGKEVRVKTIPKSEWPAALEKMGFSKVASDAMIKMTEIVCNQSYQQPNRPFLGKTALNDYIEQLVKSASQKIQ